MVQPNRFGQLDIMGGIDRNLEQRGARRCRMKKVKKMGQRRLDKIRVRIMMGVKR